MAVLTAQVLTQQAVLLARGGPEAESAARLLLRASLCESEARAAALHSGVLSAILPYLRPSTPSDVLVLLTQTYSNFCRHGESELPVELELVAPALPFIKDLLDCEDQHVLEAACAAFTNITHGGGERARAVREVDGLTARLETLLAHPAPSVKLAALLALGNILAAGNTQTENCLGTTLSAILKDGPPSLATGAARAAGNMFADPASIQPALDAGVLPLLCDLLQHDDSTCRDEAARALANLCYFGSIEQRDLFANSDVLNPFYNALEAAASAPLTLQLLAGLNALLRAAEKDDTTVSRLDKGKEKNLVRMLFELGVKDLAKRLLKHVDKDVQSQALQLQTAVTFYTRAKDVIYEGGTVFTIAGIAKGLQSLELIVRTSAARAARRMVYRAFMDHSRGRSMNHNRVDRSGDVMIQFLDKAIIERLIAALDSNDCPELQREAADALSTYYNLNITENCHYEKAVPKLAALAGKGGEATIPAINALIFIASPHGARKKAVRDSGVVTTLLPHLRLDAPLELLDATLDLYREMSQCLKKEEVEMFAPVLPRILDLLTIEHLDIRKYCLLTLDHIMISHEGNEAVLAVPGLLTRVLNLLGTEVRARAMDFVATLLKGNHTQKEQCLDAGCLDHIVRIFTLLAKKSKLSYDEQDLKWGACRAVSAIFRGSPAQIQRAIDKGLLDHILNILANLRHWYHAEEAALEAINNLCANGSVAQCGQFVASGGLQIWTTVLQGDYAKYVKNMLVGLQALLQTIKKDQVEVKKVDEDENENEEEEEDENEGEGEYEDEDEDEDDDEDDDEDEDEDEDEDDDEDDDEDEDEDEDEDQDEDEDEDEDEDVGKDEVKEEEVDEKEEETKTKAASVDRSGVETLRTQLTKLDFNVLLREAQTRFDISWSTYNSLVNSAAEIGINLKP